MCTVCAFKAQVVAILDELIPFSFYNRASVSVTSSVSEWLTLLVDHRVFDADDAVDDDDDVDDDELDYERFKCHDADGSGRVRVKR